MKIVCVSDTHRRHNEVVVPNGDVLIFAGDGDWSKGEHLISFIDWFASHPHEYKIMISGNHDFFFDQATATKKTIYMNEIFTRGIHYLENSGIEIEGVKFWGSPITPTFLNWAFMCERGFEISKVWAQIPEDTDVLITHGPPQYIMDKCRDGHVGCYDLAMAVRRIKPKFHIFGHIHSKSGIEEIGEVKYINASVLDEDYQVAYEAKVIELN